MNKSQLLTVWESFAEKNDFRLNPEKWVVETVAEGVLENEKNYGLKLCPCRLRDDTRQRDLELICPCNFKIQDVWENDGRCWCGLFVRR